LYKNTGEFKFLHSLDQALKRSEQKRESKVKTNQVSSRMAATRDLEKEFDPTQWSKRITNPQELLASHVEFGRKGEGVFK
jgi:hypothetical protein